MKYRKIVACILAGSVLLSTNIGTTFAEGDVQFTDDSTVTAEGGEVVEPEVQEPETQEPETSEPEVPEVPEVQEPEVQEPEVQEPEVSDPEFVPEDPEVQEDPTVEEQTPTPEEVTPSATPSVEPTPIEEKRNLVINFENCKYGSIVTVNGDTGVIATINVDGENNEVNYNGESFNVEGDVILEDIKDTNISVETEWDDLGSDVVSVNATDSDGNVLFSKSDYEYPNSETTVDFIMGEKGNTDLYIEFDNMSDLSDFILDLPYDENSPIFDTPLKEMIGGSEGLEQLISQTDPLQEGDELLGENGLNPVSFGDFRDIPDSGTALITMGRSLEYTSGSHTTHEYNVKVNDSTGSGAFGYCFQANLSCPNNTKCKYALVDGRKLSKPYEDANAAQNIDIMKLLMLSKPGWACEEFAEQAFSHVWGSYDKTVCYIHACLSYMYNGDYPGLNGDELAGIKHAIHTAYLYLTNYFSKNPPANPGPNFEKNCRLEKEFRKNVDLYKLYVASPGNANLQDIGFLVRGNNYGMISLKKRSKNENMTDGNPYYSLKGAVYGVYSDKACKKEVGTITTDENGNGSIKKLKLKEHYWVKEKKASPGYKLDPNVYEKITRAY